MNDQIASVLAALITGILGYYGSKYLDGKKYNTHLASKRLYKVYLPLFKAVEPYIYTKINISDAEKLLPVFKQVINDSYELIEPELSALLKEFISDVQTSKIDHRVFYTICDFVDDDYEKLKKTLRLPKRGLLFKYRHNQLTKSARAEFDWCMKKFVEVLLLLPGLVFLYFLFFAIKAFLSLIH